MPYRHTEYVSISTVKTNIYRIECLLIVFQNCPYIVCEKIASSEYLDHFNSYEIYNGTEIYFIYEINEFDGPPIALYSNPN